MITSLGCIWYPSSLNDKFLPSKVTLIRYLQEREKSKENVNTWEPNLKREPAPCPVAYTRMVGAQCKQCYEAGDSKGKSKRKEVGEAGQLLQELGQLGKARQLPPFCDWDREAMSHFGSQWIPESMTKSHVHTCVPMVLDFPLPQRAEGSIAIICVNMLHSLHFAHFPKGVSHFIWGQQ